MWSKDRACNTKSKHRVCISHNEHLSKGFAVYRYTDHILVGSITCTYTTSSLPVGAGNNTNLIATISYVWFRSRFSYPSMSSKIPTSLFFHKIFAVSVIINKNVSPFLYPKPITCSIIMHGDTLVFSTAWPEI